MTKTASKVLLFPKSRRAEQTGFTRKGFPARWLGLILMTTVGAAWAINPTADTLQPQIPEAGNRIDKVVFTGEPQTVSQLMGALVGPESTPQKELRSLSSAHLAARRVVISQELTEATRPALDLAGFSTAVESLEGELAKEGHYPALPASDVKLEDVGYRTDGNNFKLISENNLYQSGKGLKSMAQELPRDQFRLAGHLQDVTVGWGPFSREQQEFSGRLSSDESELAWLAEQVATPNWAARMYFPVDRKTTGYAFRKTDGSSAYRSGELLYDGVTGTFQMKLFRKSVVESRELSSGKLERELSQAVSGSELVGDSELLSDLGFLKGSVEADAVVHLASPTRLSLSASSALDGLALATFSRHMRTLDSADFSPKHGGTESAASVVGRVIVEDKLGQVHDVRLRAGRAQEFDWVVGQLCLQPAADQVIESSAYDDAFQYETKSNVIAGK